MPFENEADAAAQLFNAIEEDGNARKDAFTPDAPASDQAATEVGADESATVEDTFSSIDPNTLSPELLPFYRSMQADYTKKTQAVASERKAFEQLEEFGGVETALEAINFANNLATDPNYALSVHQQLSEALTQAGLTPAQASQAATEAITEQQSTAQSDDFAFGDEYDSKAVQELKAQLAAQQEKLSGFEQWREQQERDAFNTQLANEMARQESLILHEHPEYGEKDMERVYTLSYAFGGNLEQANEVYRNMQTDLLSDYIAKKGSVSSGVSGVQGGAVAAHEEAPKFNGLYDKNLERLVRERLAQELAD